MKLINTLLFLGALFSALFSVIKFGGIIYIYNDHEISHDIVWYIKQMSFVIALVALSIFMYRKGKEDASNRSEP